MQKMVFLNGVATKLDELNSLLESGWKVKSMQAVAGKDAPCCYVVIEKTEQAGNEHRR